MVCILAGKIYAPVISEKQETERTAYKVLKIRW
jgi:hypothetical protein